MERSKSCAWLKVIRLKEAQRRGTFLTLTLTLTLTLLVTCSLVYRTPQ